MSILPELVMAELPPRNAGIRMSKRVPALEWVAVAPGVLLLEGFSGLGGTDAVRLSIRIGLILTLVSTILQLMCLVLAGCSRADGS
jgi:hypothetical protein